MMMVIIIIIITTLISVARCSSVYFLSFSLYIVGSLPLHSLPPPFLVQRTHLLLAFHR